MAHGKFEFVGTGIGYLGIALLSFILTVVTLGLYGPWAYCAKVRWKTERTLIDGKRLTFKGTGLGIFGTFLLIVVLSIITLGIYIPWGVCKLERWRIHNTYFADTGDVEQ